MTADDSRPGISRPPFVRPQVEPARYWTKEFWLALVAIGATVLTGIAAQIFTYQSTRSLSSEEFQRTERRNAYAELNAKAKILEDVEVDTDTEVFKFRLDEPGMLQRTKQRQDDLARTDAARSQLTSAAAQVDLVGSGPALSEMIQLRNAHSDVDTAYNYLANEEILWTAAPASADANYRKAIDNDIKTYDEKRSAATEARHAFVDAARGDLGIHDDLKGSEKASARAQRLLSILLAGLVFSALSTVVTRGQWISLLPATVFVYLLQLLLHGCDMDTSSLVVVAASVGAAPFVVRHLWKKNGPPWGKSARPRFVRWAVRRTSVAWLIKWRYQRRHPVESHKETVAAAGEGGSDSLT